MTTLRHPFVLAIMIGVPTLLALNSFRDNRLAGARPSCGPLRPGPARTLGHPGALGDMML